MDADPWRLSRPVRCVTARQLARNTSQILDEIRREAHTVMVIRHGVPVALLGPTPDNVLPIAAPPPSAEEPEELDLSGLDLSALQRRILVAMDRLDFPRVREALGAGHGEFSLELLGLQMKHLVVNGLAGHQLTREGLRVAQALQLAGDEVF